MAMDEKQMSDLRHELLIEAKDLLYRNWDELVMHERVVAELEKRAPVAIKPPSLRKIMKVAEDMNEFVFKKT